MRNLVLIVVALMLGSAGSWATTPAGKKPVAKSSQTTAKKAASKGSATAKATAKKAVSKKASTRKASPRKAVAKKAASRKKG